MQAKAPDAFALKNSGLNGFLYADVGPELNGCALTVLSMIARLGQVPWAQAARWVWFRSGLHPTRGSPWLARLWPLLVRPINRPF
jgi:hypothetical protein